MYPERENSGMNMERRWLELADRTGLTYNKSGFDFTVVKGIYRTRSVTLEFQPIGWCDGGSPFVFTLIRINLNRSTCNQLYLSTKWIFWKSKLEVGDLEFDRIFNTKCNSHDYAKRLLSSPTLRDRLIIAQIDNLNVFKTELCIHKDGVESNVDKLCSIFDLGCDLAEIVETINGNSSNLI